MLGSITGLASAHISHRIYGTVVTYMAYPNLKVQDG